MSKRVLSLLRSKELVLSDGLERLNVQLPLSVAPASTRDVSGVGAVAAAVLGFGDEGFAVGLALAAQLHQDLEIGMVADVAHRLEHALEVFLVVVFAGAILAV